MALPSCPPTFIHGLVSERGEERRVGRIACFCVEVCVDFTPRKPGKLQGRLVLLAMAVPRIPTGMQNIVSKMC